MTAPCQGHSWGCGNPEEASHPTGLEGETVREGFLEEATYELSIAG